MKTILKLSVILSFSFFLFSCDGNTDRIRYITNNSSSTISVSADGTVAPNYQAEVASGETVELYFGGQMGGSESIELPAMGITSFIITNAAGDTCLKDYLPQNNWDIQVEQTKKRPSNWKHEYTFIVNDSDF